LAAQKFITDIATDAFQFCKIRQQGNRSKQGKVRIAVIGIVLLVKSSNIYFIFIGSQNGFDYGGSVGSLGRVRRQYKKAGLLFLKCLMFLTIFKFQ
jgi:hypothetical protein